MRRKLIITASVVAGIVIIAGATLLILLNSYKNTYTSMTFADIDLSQVADGVYYGEHDIGLVGAKVKVTVERGSIANVELLEHKNGMGESAEVITDRIVDSQKVDVDAVTGATASSNVIKKAVENALTK